MGYALPRKIRLMATIPLRSVYHLTRQLFKDFDMKYVNKLRLDSHVQL